MSDLSTFLLARVAEDEARVDGIYQGEGDPDFFWGPHRIGAECQAKRRIVAEHPRRNFVTVVLFAAIDSGAMCPTCRAHDGDAVTWPCLTLRALAVPYADHPDYRKEWAV